MGCDSYYDQEPQPEVNEELLKRVVKRIERDQNWDQEYWGMVPESLADKLEVEGPYLASGTTYLRIGDAELQIEQDICGTAFCMAGQTVLEAGDSLLLDKDTLEANWCLTSDGEFRNVYERAKELLGVTDGQAAVIFSDGAGNDDFERYKRLLANMTGVELD